ncbi:hypothetical protein [Halocella sp. SP3-1]|uniref:hypothetical protein n=1 Tax=Halocella sp. SP3-1 TaxID=2382161 RepID=UPI000F75CF0E|nr:hypothetical protein [Halocella sp. SP3-1]AZO95123.1 hypothetical protein D7D81_11305 [Halocella sp. SP3-1]
MVRNSHEAEVLWEETGNSTKETLRDRDPSNHIRTVELFDRYYRGTNTSQESERAGLGLWLLPDR